MTTVQILQAPPESNGKMRYRAIHRNRHADGISPGAALDALEGILPDDVGTMVIVQKFKADAYFGAEQQARLAELMARLESARAQNRDLGPAEMAELEQLVDLELLATASRAQDVYRQISDK